MLNLFALEKLPRMVGNIGTLSSEVIVNVDQFEAMRFFSTFLRDLKSLIFTLGTARRTIICLVLRLKEPGCDILPTLCDLMTSVGLYSGSISDINLKTVSVVSTSSTGS
jgi:hypothetical protein